MLETELRLKLAALDEEIKEARLKAENAKADLELVATKRRNFARVNCEHPKEQRYERSCMGREIDIYCGICDTAL
jgi:hypothetical protein